VILTFFNYGGILRTGGKGYQWEKQWESFNGKEKSNELYEPMFIVEILSSPIVLLFFVLIGLSMDLFLIFSSPIILVLAIVYFTTRVLGKGIGAYSMGKVTGLPKKVRNNLPLCLVTQAGVAIGLAGLVYNELSAIGMTSEATLVINVTGIAVILAELIGPLLVKKAVFRSGEANT